MIKRIFTRLLAVLFFSTLFGTFAGCNTVAGIGQDVEQGGRAIKNEAREKR